MRRTRPALAASLLLLGLAAGPAAADPYRAFCQVYLDLVQNGGCTYDEPAAAPEPPGRQVVEGSLVSPMGSLVTTVGLAPVTTRGESANGAATWTFRVRPGTVGGVFTLRPSPGVNVDVVFYDDGEGVNHRAPRPTGAFYSTGSEGEHGVVPARSAVAVVTLAEGSLADFTYQAAPRGR